MLHVSLYPDIFWIICKSQSTEVISRDSSINLQVETSLTDTQEHGNRNSLSPNPKTCQGRVRQLCLMNRDGVSFCCCCDSQDAADSENVSSLVLMLFVGHGQNISGHRGGRNQRRRDKEQRQSISAMKDSGKHVYSHSGVVRPSDWQQSIHEI